VKVTEVALYGEALENFKGRFFLLVDQSGDGCWPWLGARHSSGSGRYLWRVKDGGQDGYVLAHRVAYFVLTGELPRYLRNLCGNPLCCRPLHWWVKPDRRWKPKPQKAVRGAVRRLSAEEVRHIRRLASLSHNEAEIGKEFGLTRRQVADIALGRVRPEAGGHIRRSRHRGIRYYHQQFETMLQDMQPDKPVRLPPQVVPQSEVQRVLSERATGCPVPTGRPFPSKSYGQPMGRRTPRYASRR
jgi:hypothetical protein